MAIRYFFNDELAGRQAAADIRNLGFWAITFTSGLPNGAKIGVECSELAEGICEVRFTEFLI